MLGPGAATFSCLLVVTGAAKLRRPGDTSKALSAFGLPNRRIVGLVIGLIEVVVGVAALMTGSTAAWMAQSLLYAGFAVWIAVALVRHLPIASCGCLGTPDTPPYWGHLALDLVGATLSLGVAMTGSAALISGTPLETVATLTVVGVGCYLAWLVIGDGARVRETYKT